jgi:hypothetical protein
LTAASACCQSIEGSAAAAGAAAHGPALDWPTAAVASRLRSERSFCRKSAIRIGLAT